MYEHRVAQLGYLGVDVSDMARWQTFATDVLGLQARQTDADGTLFLKMDDYHHRLALHRGGRDDIAYAGWEAPHQAALEAVAERLESHGVSVTPGTEADARARRVTRLITVQDPSGVANEVYWGPQIDAERSFRSPRPIGRFVAGNLGFGHIVLAVDDYEASLRFYCDGLGLLVSDYIELDMGAAGKAKVAFLHSGPRHHSIAIAQFPAPRRLHHFMLQLQDMDDVGTTYDLCQDLRLPITSTLGRHTNDHMTSFYVATPSGFQVEYGYGGREIDDRSWKVETYNAPSIWGHRSPATAPPAQEQATA